MSDTLQLWVRTDKGQTFGPLTPTSIELLLDNGVLQGKVQLSVDGKTYVYPGRVPGVRMIFPKTLWGDTVVPGDDIDAQWSEVNVPPPIEAGLGGDTADGPPVLSPNAPPGGPGARPAAGPGPKLVAGPGARPAAGPGARPTAGPGARTAAGPGPRAAPHASSPSGLQAGPAGDGGLSQILEAFGATPSAPASSPSGFTPSPGVSSVGRGGSSIESLMNSFDFGASAPSGLRKAPAAAPAAAPAPARTRGASGSGPRPAAAPAPARPVPNTDLGVTELPTSGDLAAVSPIRLYFLAAAGNATGLLVLTLPDAQVQIHFRKGNPEFFDSSHADDQLASWLVRARLCSFEQLAKAEAGKGNFGGELLPALFAMGLVNPNEAFQKLAERATAILRRAMLAEAGTFSWQPLELDPAKSMPIGNKWGRLVEQLRKTHHPDVRRRVQPILNLPVMKSGGAIDVSQLRLTPQETRALTYFDGVRSLGQLVEDLPQEAEAILRTAWMLKDCDVVAFAGTPVATVPRAQAPQGDPLEAEVLEAEVLEASIDQSPPRVSSPSGVQRAPDTRTASGGVPVISAAVARPSGAPGMPPVPGAPRAPPVMAPAPRAPGPPTISSPSRVPGPPVVQASSPSGVRAAAAPYPGQAPAPRAAATASRPGAPAAKPVPANPAPAAAAPNFGAEIKQLTALLEKMKAQNHFEVLAVAKEADANAVKMAYFKLARSHHPDTVPPGAPQALHQAKADVFARIGEAQRVLQDPALRADYTAELEAGTLGEKVDVAQILMSEELFQKGTILVKARKYPEAVRMLDDAIAANPDEGEFYGWRGYAKFFTHADKKQGQVEAMKDINECLKRTDRIAAVWYFQGFMAKVLGDLAAAKKHFKKCVDMDPKHTDAQRELRLMK